MSGEIKFQRNNFLRFRSVDKIHLGAINLDVYKGEEFEFDGQVLKYAGMEHSVPQLRAGIKAGWFVLADTEVSEDEGYKPLPAGVVVRPADSASDPDRTPMAISTVDNEERVVQTVSESNLGARDGKIMEVQGEGVPVKRMLSPASKKVEVTSSMQASTEVRRLDETGSAKVATDINDRPGGATGDVSVATTGDELTDLLPDAQVAAHQPANISEVSPQPQAEPPPSPEVVVGAPKKPSTKKGRSGKPTAPNIQQVKTADGRDLAWDLGNHWKQRIKSAITDHGTDVPALQAIMSVETPGVKKKLQAHLDG